MLRMLKYVLILLSFQCILIGQEIVDTIALKEVVYTAQVSPQKVNASVYEVTVISNEQIQQAAAVNLADLLNQTLNVQVIPSSSTGKSGLNLMGLNSQYVKVLVDNIPIINDEGLGNFTDFTQINLSDIEQIEIVEGAMAVEYGADAVSGVINIITKKSAKKKLEARLYAQEETIGKEYNFENEGRHIAGIDVKKRITNTLHAGINYNQNLFNGYYNDKKGEKYAEDNGLRGYEWLPKQQYDAKAFVSYKINSTKLFYRTNYFQEQIQYYNPSVITNPNPQFGDDFSEPTAKDVEYKTKRWYHLLNANGKAWNNGSYNLSFSYQKQDRDANFYTYDILNDAIENENKFTYESRKTYYTKALVEHILTPEKWSIQLGVEANQTNGMQSPLARSVDSSTNTVERELGSYDFFMSSNIHVSNKVTVRPGIRALFSSRFKPVYAYSLSASYLFGKDWELRTVLGSAPKNPTYEQLFTYFVDSNHYVVGNEDLKPERGNSVFIHLKKNIKIHDNIQWKAKLSTFYMHLKDQIELIVINEQPLQYQYGNFDTFTNRGITFSNQINSGRFSAQLGATYTGIGYDSTEKDVLYAMQGNVLLNYLFPKAKLYLTSNFKYNGPQYSWVYDEDIDDLVKGKLNGYAWWDVSLRKKLFTDFEITAGIRNATNVVNVRTTATAAGAHSEQPTNRLLGYGRSFFLRLQYEIPFK